MTATRLSQEYGDTPQDPAKEHPLDTAVWRRQDETEVHWPSPWGPGRPGWHAECATMVLSTFSPGVDLHAGGADLRYPHHAVEALLAERAIGVTPFARAWLHPGGGQGGRGEDGEIHGDPRGPRVPAAGVGAVDAAPRPGTSSRCSAWADPLRVQVPPT